MLNTIEKCSVLGLKYPHAIKNINPLITFGKLIKCGYFLPHF